MLIDHLSVFFREKCLVRSSAHILIEFFFLIYLFGCIVQHVGSQLPHQGLNPGPWHLEHEVLTPGPPGKSLIELFFCYQLLLYCMSCSYILEIKPLLNLFNHLQMFFSQSVG